MVSTTSADEAAIATLRVKLRKGDLPLGQKYRILFSLRNCANESACDALVDALHDDSALFRHDVVFALGQRQDAAAVNVLRDVLNDASEHPMVRHEAAEALGAIGTAECLAPVEAHVQSEHREVAETCVLAKQRIEYFEGRQYSHESKYSSVDPTPPFASDLDLEELACILLDEDSRLFDRYRALFSLRNRGGDDAVGIMAQCILSSQSALLKHEIAYVLGQMLSGAATDTLQQVLRDHLLQDPNQHAMVRHEAAEALGAIADEKAVETLRDFVACDEPIVAESCVVALDMLESERRGEFEYADTGQD